MAEDDLVNLLVQMARDVFSDAFRPDLEKLTEVAKRLRQSGMPAGFIAREHDLHPSFIEALAEDPDLKIFAPAADQFVISSNGFGLEIQTDALPGLLIASAAAAHVAKGRATDDLDGFLDEVSETLITFRRLIAGEEATALTLIAFDGITLRDDARIDTPWGVLRGALEYEAETSPMNVAPTAILAFERPVRFSIGVIGVVRDVEGAVAIQERISRARELLSLAALLAIERDDCITLGAVWSTSVEPAIPTSGFSVAYPAGAHVHTALFHQHKPMPRGGGEVLTEEEERQLRDWAQVVDNHYHPAIQIAVTRTISALLERTDPQDALIDAVMAMENLFGYGATTEVTFRVTSALALLLEPDATKRSALRSELGKVYDVRSSVVHGAEITPKMKLADRKEEAIKTVVRALRVLFDERPDLIPARDRGVRLILGSADPA